MGGATGRYTGWVTDLVNKVRAEGGDVVLYNGTYPYMGTNLIDADATHQRVNPWIFWKYGVNYYFYYHANLYNDNNPFAGNYYYSSGGYRHGLGNYVYPGKDLKSGESAYNYGLDGPISSIRLKNWRRGQQDYEYLWLAKQAGKTAAVTALVNKIVPKALCQLPAYSTRNWPTTFNDPAPWVNRGYSFEEARKELAVLIAGSEPTAVPTGATGKASLRMRLVLQGIWNSSYAESEVEPVEVRYRRNGGGAQSRTMELVGAGPGPDGLYIYEGLLTDLEPGSYEFSVEARSYLTRSLGAKELVSGENFLEAATIEKMLLGGDAVDDEKISAYDSGAVVKDYYKIGDSPADFNFDNKVNTLDFSYVTANYMLSSSSVLGEKTGFVGRGIMEKISDLIWKGWKIVLIYLWN